MAPSDYGREPAKGFRHIEFSQTPSTNIECLERARAGDEGNLWITAQQQTAGRARRGRSWISEPGNLYASLLLIDPAPMERLASLPLAVSLAVFHAIRAELPPGADIHIKWPNDILIEGKKTCGILLEGEHLKDRRYALAIGCGINIVHKPDEALYPVTCLREQGSSASPETLFAHLYLCMDEMLKLWDKGKGTADLVRQWRNAAIGIGGPVTVNLHDTSIKGIFAGIDEQGLMLLDLEDGSRQLIAAGDVFFPKNER